MALPASGPAISSDTAHVSVDSDEVATARVIGAEDGVVSGMAVAYSAQTRFHISPIPSPATIRELDEIYPGVAKLIFEDFHAQSAHRRDMERNVITTKSTLALRGQIIGGLIGGVGILGSLIVIGLGQPWGELQWRPAAWLVSWDCSSTGIRIRRRNSKKRPKSVAISDEANPSRP
jgi:hypothetical protein